MQPFEIRVKRRRQANLREKKRMTNLNVAYERLRYIVTKEKTEGEKKLSKFDTLKKALSYIDRLQDMLS